ncbi:hypothetical protein RDV89_15640 [Nocardioides zeae]|uniref:Uncharacterized protein n=1 Tax=Nocardioides imazamoxiresistens TaxID=3231893 RepID=A0ABU3PZ50_9ACTN|nr:hypothetical protein [Nocardioides zeae]MDT9594517.1 hypothetical protein [Nocardioides zeae]
MSARQALRAIGVRRAAAAALLAVVLAVTLVVVTSPFLGEPGGGPGGDGRRDAAQGEGPTDDGPGGPREPGEPGEPGDGDVAGPGATAPLGAPPPPGSSPTGGIEAAPTTETTEQPGDAVRAADEAQEPTPRVDGPFPTSAESAVGRLVPSYPADVVPPVPGSTVRTSSLSPSTERVQVALVAAGAGGDEVVAFYLAELRRQGFEEVATSALPGRSAVALRRGGSSVVVTVGPERDVYSLFATLLREDV